MNKKYKLTDKTIQLSNTTLYQIEALRDFGSVSKGEKGGYLEKEANLSVSGDAWVYGNASVYGDAGVYGNASVSGDARVSGDAWVYGNASVSGDAWVYGNASVSGDARVYGNAGVYGDASVYGDARVYGNASVSGDARVYGDASVSGKLKLRAGLFFGIRWSSDTEIKEVEIENGNYLVYKGNAIFGEDKPEIEEMTMEDICKDLGKTIKIKK